MRDLFCGYVQDEILLDIIIYIGLRSRIVILSITYACFCLLLNKTTVQKKYEL